MGAKYNTLPCADRVNCEKKQIAVTLTGYIFTCVKDAKVDV